jgi:hypothetical protein
MLVDMLHPDCHSEEWQGRLQSMPLWQQGMQRLCKCAAPDLGSVVPLLEAPGA